MKTTYWLFIILASACCLPNAHARHIIGGVMSYECLGNDNYKFTLKIYRDCGSNGAQFDDPAEIAVYRCGTSISCVNLDQNDAYLTLNVNLMEKSNILPPDYPCLTVPPTVCVEEGIYTFTIKLPKSPEIYHVIYQRCCRNNSINNIVDPSNTGATFGIELLPAAQNACNNSPEFSFFPPTLICANEDLEFDHSAKDKDGDQLVYEFCHPLEGGGPLGTQGSPGIPTSCGGVTPSPPCAPPYSNVNFIIPSYSFDQPLGINSPMSVDPSNGLLTANPTQLGQFVVGVCVSEYRNGVLLSKVRRDFQFNVANCAPKLFAQIQNDKIIGVQQYVVNSCGNKTVNFINQSFPTSNIFDYEWKFADGTPNILNSVNASITFSDVGTYKGTMVINPGTTCADTANIFVNVYPDINADFTFTYDICTAGPVQYTDLSIAEVGSTQNWKWDFSDGGLSNTQNPIHEFVTPGKFPVELLVSDFNGCKDSITKTIEYFPAPPIVVIAPSKFVGCIPADIFFNNLSKPINDEYSIVWDFGDGSTVDELSPNHLYTVSGTYTVTVNITSPLGCKVSGVFKNLIKIEPSPIAQFTFDPSDPSILNPTVTIVDQSQLAVSWGYDFGDGAKSFLQNPIHTFQDTGLYVVTQYARHQSGCVDTFQRIIDIRPEITYFLPNAFSPNGDGNNDRFLGKGFFLGMQDFEMTIWSRWGQRLFVSKDPDLGWDGKANVNGDFVQNGVYVCVVKFRDARGKFFEFKGYATVVK